jgi:hypothetical protein
MCPKIVFFVFCNITNWVPEGQVEASFLLETSSLEEMELAMADKMNL